MRENNRRRSTRYATPGRRKYSPETLGVLEDDMITIERNEVDASFTPRGIFRYDVKGGAVVWRLPDQVHNKEHHKRPTFCQVINMGGARPKNVGLIRCDTGLRDRCSYESSRPTLSQSRLSKSRYRESRLDKSQKRPVTIPALKIHETDGSNPEPDDYGETKTRAKVNANCRLNESVPMG